ncbi:MAG TPA: hypothetical protein VMF07_02385 [Solirubrobacteraceae bacterium]|nr:hypothetical protein [Solirubrobacteraceae bacterium]
MSAPFVFLAVLASAFAAWRRAHRGHRRPARAVIGSAPRSTVIAHDGGVRSVQSAMLTMDDEDLARLWTVPNLENLGRTYWRFLTRVTLGLIRVVYDEDSRSVVLLAKPLTLLRFEVPRYEIDRDEGKITWQIRDGLLVARSGRGSGWLSLAVKRMPASPSGNQRDVKIEVEVANFYPAIASRLSTIVYEMTQSLVHVMVTHAFLRSLENLRLDVSRVGALARR